MKGKAKWRYILFLLKPLWRKGKGYLFCSLLSYVFFVPLSQLLTALLPKEAIDAVARQEPVGAVLRIVGLFTLGLVLIGALQAIFTRLQDVYQTNFLFSLRGDVYERAL